MSIEDNSKENLADSSAQLLQLKQLYQEGQFQASFSLCKQFLRTNPQHAEVNYLMGQMYYKAKLYEKSAESYEIALQNDPTNLTIVRKLARIYWRYLAKYQHAKNYFKHYLLHDKTDPFCLLGLGSCEFKLQDYVNAVQILSQIPISDGHYREAKDKIAYCLFRLKKYDAVIDFIQGCLQKYPNHEILCSILACAYSEKGDYEAAQNLLQKTLKIHPESVELTVNLATTYRRMAKYHEGIKLCEQILAVNDNEPSALNEMSQLKAITGDIETATNYAIKYMHLLPNVPIVHMRLGIFYLLQGNFAAGWSLYEERVQVEIEKILPECLQKITLWEKQDLTNKKLLVVAEQGSGDTIQFIRYLPLLQAILPESCQLYVYVPPQLSKIMQAQFPDIQFIMEYSVLQIDYCVALMSLPYIFKTDLTNMPTPIDYRYSLSSNLSVPIVKQTGEYHIGIAWTGSSANPKNYRRAVSWELFRQALVPQENCIYHTLQFNGEGHVCPLDGGDLRVIDHCAEIKSFQDTASIVSQLDLVVCVDTAVAHLSASMAIPTWTLINLYPDWRWLLEREDTPWYPSMRLFRQDNAYSWESTLAKVRSELAQWLIQ